MATGAVVAHLRSWAHWTSLLPCATLSEKLISERFPFSETRSWFVELTRFLRRTGSPLRRKTLWGGTNDDAPHACGRYGRRFRVRHWAGAGPAEDRVGRLRPRRAAEGRPRNAGADRDLQQGPRADARAHPGGIRRAPQEPDGRRGEGCAYRLLLRRCGRRRVRLDWRTACGQCLDPRVVPRS